MNRFRFISPLALSLALASVSVTAHADPPGKAKDKGAAADKAKDKDKPKDDGKKDEGKWEKLGERTVDGKIDKDTIVVGRDDGLFDSIRVKVEGSSVETSPTAPPTSRRPSWYSARTPGRA